MATTPRRFMAYRSIVVRLAEVQACSKVADGQWGWGLQFYLACGKTPAVWFTKEDVRDEHFETLIRVLSKSA